MQKINFISFNDQPSGIYFSQFIDVANYFQINLKQNVRIIAFFPIKGFGKNKTLIKSKFPKSLVIPMIFGVKRWKKHKVILKSFVDKNDIAICRGPLSTFLSLGFCKKVIYDARAALKAEIEEYDIVSSSLDVNNTFIDAERQAIQLSDFRIAVSGKLVEYWQNEYNYCSTSHIIIPCTLNSSIQKKSLSEVQNNIIKVVYSGGIGKWQSFELVVNLLESLIVKQQNVEILFLSKENYLIDELIKKYPSKCSRKFVAHEQVYNELLQFDYGILLREENVTNKVASPVKFAEYLNAGLQVLISPELGDFSDFVKNNECGLIVKDQIPLLKKPTAMNKIKNINLCEKYFYKSSLEIESKYLELLKKINDQ